MRADQLLKALGLPEASRVDRRVPKKVFLERGDFGASDRRLIQEGIEELQWVAALKPNTVGIPAFQDELREYLEISVILVTTHEGSRNSRLSELLHRSIPYPLLLVLDSLSGIDLSVAHKRISMSEKKRTVVEQEYRTMPRSSNVTDSLEKTFLDSLNISLLYPAADLFVLYQKWIDRIVAQNVSTITNHFRIPELPGESEGLLKEVESFTNLEKDLSLLRSKAVKEKQMARRVDLNLEIKREEKRLEKIKVALLNKITPDKGVS